MKIKKCLAACIAEGVLKGRAFESMKEAMDDVRNGINELIGCYNGETDLPFLAASFALTAQALETQLTGDSEKAVYAMLMETVKPEAVKIDIAQIERMAGHGGS